MPRGYDQRLYILPFDHRGTFEAKMFGWKEPLTSAQTAEIAAAKGVIYDAFKAAIAAGVPKGPMVGQVLREVEDWWIDHDFIDDKLSAVEKLKSIVQGMAF